MADISTAEFEAFEAPGCEYDEDAAVTGTFVAPESDTKTVIIPSPPSTSVVKSNPRKGFLCITKGGVPEGYEGIDALKERVVEENVVYVFPMLREDEEDALHDLHATYSWMFAKAGTVLNIKKFEIQLLADEDSADLAEAFVDYASDELSVDFDDPETIEL